MWDKHAKALIFPEESFFGPEKGTPGGCVVRYLTPPGLFQVLELFHATGEWLDAAEEYVFKAPKPKQ
jgi:hypothetical protein